MPGNNQKSIFKHKPTHYLVQLNIIFLQIDLLYVQCILPNLCDDFFLINNSNVIF